MSLANLPLLVLDTGELRVEPGGEVALGIRVRNQAAVVDELDIQVLGPTAEWARAEPRSLSLFPGTDGRAEIRFRPPRTPKLVAGTLPVGVRVVSRVDPGRTAVVEECRLEVGAFREVTAELWPRSSRGRRRGRHEVRLRNEGNAPAGVSLELADLDGSSRVTVQPERVVVPPGQVAGSKVTVRPRRLVWFGGVETYSFAVKATPEPGKDLKVEGTMRQGPLVPGTVAMLALVAIIAVAAGGVLMGRGALPTGAISRATPSPPNAVADAALPLGQSAPSASPSASASASASPLAPGAARSPSPGPSASGAAASGGSGQATAAPTPDNLPWPSPPDCTTYNPSALTLSYDNVVSKWVVQESGNPNSLLNFMYQADGSDGLALAKRYTQLCFIGRSNTYTVTHWSYILKYWRGATGIATTIATRDCVAYDRPGLTVVTVSSNDYEVTDGTIVLQQFASQADASAGEMVLEHGTNICYVGRDEPLNAPNRASRLTEYYS